MQKRVSGFLKSFTLIALLLPAGLALADWELEGKESEVNFTSIKNNGTAEVHHFSSIQGNIGADGSVLLTINLASVDTAIDIRDERMREVLFETETFPTANITTKVDPDLLEKVTSGDTVNTELTLTLALHGVEKSYTAPVVLIGETGNSIQVFNPSPIIVNADDFGMGAGVEALQKIAGLKAISTAVPVSVHLIFIPSTQEN